MSKRSKPAAVLLLCVLAVAGCAAERAAPSAGTSAPDPTPAATTQPTLNTGLAARSENPATARRIIKNASLSLDVDNPDAASRKAERIADDAGGYVASTERYAGNDDGARGRVKIVMRVPVQRFTRTLDALHALAPGRGTEQISTEDVTEEYIDLDARLKTQKGLEEQYLQILKGATKVDDALSVQKQLAEVRGEIEKIEGRKRFLESRVALSTITLELGQRAPLVTAHWSDFWHSVRRAGADSLNVAAALVTGSIRAAGVLLPVLILFGLPLLLLLRVARRRFKAA